MKNQACEAPGQVLEGLFNDISISVDCGILNNSSKKIM